MVDRDVHVKIEISRSGHRPVEVDCQSERITVQEVDNICRKSDRPVRDHFDALRVHVEEDIEESPEMGPGLLCISFRFRSQDVSLVVQIRRDRAVSVIGAAAESCHEYDEQKSGNECTHTEPPGEL